MFTAQQKRTLNAIAKRYSNEVIGNVAGYYLNSGIWTDMLTDEENEFVYAHFKQAAVDALDMWAINDMLHEINSNFKIQGLSLLTEIIDSDMEFYSNMDGAVEYIAKRASIQVA